MTTATLPLGDEQATPCVVSTCVMVDLCQEGEGVGRNWV